MSEEQTKRPAPPTEQRHDNYRVVIDVPNPRSFHGVADHGEWLSDGKKIVAQVQRHVDGGRDATLLFDRKTVCKHCGLEWEVDGNGYPWCCDEAQAWADGHGITPEPDESVESRLAKVDAEIEKLENQRDALVREKSKDHAVQVADAVVSGIKRFVEN
jgi:hypothetical protein